MEINDYFDRVVFLNTKHRIDRELRIREELKSANVKAKRFEAIEHERPAMSFNLSCIKMLKEFLSSSNERLFVFEDDAKFLDNHASIISNALIDLSRMPRFDLFYLGCNLFDFKFARATKNLFRIQGAWTTHAIGYSRSAAQKIVNQFDPEKDIYDNWLCRKFISNNVCYVSNPIAVVQRHDFSDIEKRHTGYDESWAITQQRMKRLSDRFQ